MANLFHLLLLSQLSISRELCPTPSPVPTLSSAPTTISLTPALYQRMREFRMAELGGTFGGVAQLQSFGHFKDTQGSCCWTMHFISPYTTEPFHGGTIPRLPILQRSDSMLVCLNVPHVLNLPGELFIVFRFHRRNQIYWAV